MRWVLEGVGGFSFLDAAHPAVLAGPTDSDPSSLQARVPPEGRTVLVVTEYEQARRFLSDPRWSRAAATGRGPVGPASAMSVTELDPPRHTFVRGMVGRAFSPRAVGRLAPRIRRRAGELVEAMAAAGPPSDLVAAFCAPFAFTVHCDLLGVPAHAREAVRASSTARSDRPDVTSAQKYDAEVALHETVTTALDHVRERGGGGVFADLLAARGRALLTDAELTGLASSLFFDGHLLAGAQIANAVLSLLRRPDQLRLVTRSPQVLAQAVEELLRWSPSITLGMPRMACAAVDLGGGRAEPGQLAAVAFGVANRDPGVFDRPHDLTLDRHPNRHLSFGRGVHHCLGAHLMRLELHIALEALLGALPDLALAVDEQQLTWTASHTIRRLSRLPLTWTPRHPARGAPHPDRSSIVSASPGSPPRRRP